MSDAGLTRRGFAAAAAGTALAAGLPAAARARPGRRPWPDLIGADISWVPEDESAGATYFENRVRRDPLEILLALEYSSRKRYVNDLVHAHADGWGSFIWEPTRHQEAIFDKDGKSAGEGPRPDLLSQGLNAAEAPGATAAPPAAVPHRPTTHGGRYDADPAFLDLYRTMARDYGLKAPSPAPAIPHRRP